MSCVFKAAAMGAAVIREVTLAQTGEPRMKAVLRAESSTSAVKSLKISVHTMCRSSAVCAFRACAQGRSIVAEQTFNAVHDLEDKRWG